MKEVIKREIIAEFKRISTEDKKLSSAHEGYARLRGNCDQLTVNCNFVDSYMESLWQSVKTGNEVNQAEWISHLRDRLLKVAQDAITMAAMIERFDNEVISKASGQIIENK